MVHTKSVRELSDDLDCLHAELQVLADKSESSGLDETEQARFNELTDKGGLIETTRGELGVAAERHERIEKIHGIQGGQAEQVRNILRGRGGPYKEGQTTTSGPEPFALQDSDGKWHRSVSNSTPLTTKPHGEAPTCGELLAFWLTNDEKHLGGKNPMAAITGHSGGEAGGFLVPSMVSGQVIDLARSAMVTGRAGVRSMSLSAAETKIIKVASDPTPGYAAELSAIPASQASFSAITMRPHKLGVLIPISREAIEDGANLPGILQSTTTAAIAQAVDQAVLRGAGGTEPRGIVNTNGVNTITGVAVPDSYGEVLQGVRQIYDANFAGDVSELAWVHSPREWETYAGLASTDGQPLQVPPAISGLPSYSTTAMPVNEGAGEDESSMIVGEFSNCVVGYREGQGVRVEFLTTGTANDVNGASINALTQDAQWVRFTLRFDVAVLRPDHFTILSGVTAA